MKKFFILSLFAFLTACNPVLQAQIDAWGQIRPLAAECQSKYDSGEFKTFKKVNSCLHPQARQLLSKTGWQPDLMETWFAERNAIAANADKKKITAEEAKVLMAASFQKLVDIENQRVQATFTRNQIQAQQFYNLGNQMRQQQMMQQMIDNANTPTTCTSVPMGGFVSTTCQ